MNGIKKQDLPVNIKLDIKLPADFPEKYKASLIHVADLCKVKKTIASPRNLKLLPLRAFAHLRTRKFLSLISQMAQIYLFRSGTYLSAARRVPVCRLSSSVHRS